MAHQSLKPSIVVVALLIAALCTQGAQSQAPGDEIERCNTGSFTHTYEEGMNPLMDTYNYEQILGVDGAVWDEADFDNNNIESAITQTKWKHSVGGVCRWSVQSCGSTRGVQENWAFTQYISKATPAGTNYDVKVCVQISYRISNCRERNGCNPEFEVYQFVTDSKQPSSVVRDKTRYTRSFRIRTQIPVTNTDEFCFTVPSQNQGFYLGLRDPNSCVLVSRVLAYRRECAAKQTGLVSFPDTAASADGNSRSINANCVDNAEPVSSSMNVQCLNNGLWSGVPQCRCKVGYREETVGGEKRCTACDAGTYRSASDAVDRCLTCPPNTFTVAVGAAECKCLTGYYRNNAGLANRCPSGQNEERAGFKCTQPPSKPRNVKLSRVSTESTISIRWTAPSDLGERSDIYYTVEHSDPSNIGRLINPTTTMCLTATQFQITGLRPATDYLIRVTAHNGVSDQDTNGAFSRIAEITERTANAAPSSPVDVEDLCSVVVWKEPVMPNGEIVSYDVRFYRQGSSAGITRHIADTATFYVVQSNDTPSGSGAVYVQVRATNNVGVSAYSTGVPVVCVDGVGAPSPIPAPEPATITAPGTVTETEVLGCGVLAWKPPSNRGNGQPGYVVRFFDGNTYETSNYREILRFFEDPDRRWARPESMPSTRPIYADIRTGNDIGSQVLVGPYSVKVVVADSVLCASPVSTPAPVTVTDAPTDCPDVTCPTPQEPECPAAPACDSCCSACPAVTPCPEVSPINFLDNDEVSPTNIIPGTVRNVQIQGCGIITWEAPEEDGGEALEYRVRIFTGSTYQTTISSEKKVIATFDPWVLPDSLLPQRTLHILVKAKNSAGFSAEWSEQIDLKSSCLCSE